MLDVSRFVVRALGATIALLLLMLSAAAAVAADGDLDASFGPGGIRLVGFAGGAASISASIRVQRHQR